MTESIYDLIAKTSKILKKEVDPYDRELFSPAVSFLQNNLKGVISATESMVVMDEFIKRFG